MEAKDLLAPRQRDLVTQCDRVIREAQAVLGPGLGGHSKLDLCADNISAPLDQLKVAINILNARRELKKKRKRKNRSN